MPTDTDTTYNGWANRSTWAVGMFLDGNYTGEDTYRQACRIARRHELEGELDTDALARDLRDFVHAEISGMLAGDIAECGGLAVVDWQELAEDWGSDAVAD